MIYTHRLEWREITTPLVGVIVAFLISLGLARTIMETTPEELNLIARFLLISGIISLAIGYLIFTIGQTWLRSIRLKILLAYGLGIIVAMTNIYANSHLMFLSEKDFLCLTVLSIFATILSASFGHLLALRMTKSLSILQTGVNHLAEGNFSTRVKLPETDELSNVAEAFNMMADQLEQAFARQREMEQARRTLIAAVSHDLRTPLASIRAMTEAIADGVVSEPSQVSRYHTRIGTQIDNLSNLIDDLFELSQLETGQMTLTPQAVSLNDLLSDVLESMQAQASQRGITLQATFCEALPCVRAEPSKLQRVLSNLVQNALRHTPPGGLICLVTTMHPQGVKVSVSDTGEGIAPQDLPYIFDTFYRGEKSRSRETGGSGLGLAIVKRIVEAHQGQVWVESQLGQGTQFNLLLPTN